MGFVPAPRGASRHDAHAIVAIPSPAAASLRSPCGLVNPTPTPSHSWEGAFAARGHRARPRGAGPTHPLLHPRRRGPRRRRRQPHRRSRRGARPRRRIGLRQVRHRLLDHGPRRRPRPHRRRIDQAQRRGTGRALRGRLAAHPRQPRRDDLPGPDDDAEPGAAGRHADDRGHHRAREDQRARPPRRARATPSPPSASPRPRSG